MAKNVKKPETSNSLTPKKNVVVQDKHAPALSKDDQMTALTSTITEEERTILRATYKEMESEPEKNGLTILLKLFSDYPEYKNLWPQFKFITDSSLQNAEELQKFAVVYMAGLETIVEHLDDNTALAETLARIAHKHLIKGIKRHHLDKMLPFVIETLRSCRGGKQQIDKKTNDAWKKLFDIIATMLEMYNERKK